MKAKGSKSALGQHLAKTRHKLLNKPVTEGIRVIDNEPRNKHRKVKEAIHIKLRGATLSRTGGYDSLPSTYPAEGGDQWGHERLMGHTSMADTISWYGCTP